MKILVINSGSSSLKYQVIDMETEEAVCSGYFERIGSEKAFLTHKVNGEKIKIEKAVKDHSEALKTCLIGWLKMLTMLTNASFNDDKI